MKGSSSEAIQTSKLTFETTDESEMCTLDNLYLRQTFSHSLNAGIQKVKWPISRVRHKFEPVRKLGGHSKSIKNCWGTCRRARGLGLTYKFPRSTSYHCLCGPIYGPSHDVRHQSMWLIIEPALHAGLVFFSSEQVGAPTPRHTPGTSLGSCS